MDIATRPIQKDDNEILQKIFTNILLELECFESEYLSNPRELVDLYGDYRAPNSNYYVLHDRFTGKVYGGGGYAPLTGYENICEIQKMYIASELRGQNFGQMLLEQLIEEAQKLNFGMFYIETMPQMKAAIRLYEKFGFTAIPDRLGGTGHNCCSIFMTRPVRF